MKVLHSLLPLCLLLPTVTWVYYALIDIKTPSPLHKLSSTAAADKHVLMTVVDIKDPVLSRSERKSDSCRGLPINTKTIVRYYRYKKDASHPTRDLFCGSYHCCIEQKLTANISIEADLFLFIVNDGGFYTDPPCKSPNSLWAVFIDESPMIMNRSQEELSKWDGLFNYSITFLRTDPNNEFMFRHKIRRKLPPAKEFFVPRTEMRPLRVLLYTSHCFEPHNFKVISSARQEYIIELSKYMDIQIYTNSRKCRDRFGKLVHNKEKGVEPHMDHSMFYLSFENSLCKDYITEKFWKVLESNSTTIPVVLGGLSIEDYEYIAPPNSFIHVRNFTSPEALANHLKFVAQSDNAFHYYNQWRNEYLVVGTYHRNGHNINGDYECQMCKMAHERPHNTWNTFSKDYGKHQCVDVRQPEVHCQYYNLSCNKHVHWSVEANNSQ